jgi:hypothetical protein
MWFFRAVQLEDGRWSCRRGIQEWDTHSHLDAALSHLFELAAPFKEASFFVHHLDGTIERPAST